MEKQVGKLQLALPDSKPEFVFKVVPNCCADGSAVSPPATVLVMREGDGGGGGGGGPEPPEDEDLPLPVPHPFTSNSPRAKIISQCAVL
jgi:hypothetical protein